MSSSLHTITRGTLYRCVLTDTAYPGDDIPPLDERSFTYLFDPPGGGRQTFLWRPGGVDLDSDPRFTYDAGTNTLELVLDGDWTRPVNLPSRGRAYLSVLADDSPDWEPIIGQDIDVVDLPFGVPA